MFLKKNVSLAAMILVPFLSFSQWTISGKVYEENTDQTIAGATVVFGNYQTQTDSQGNFYLNSISAGSYTLSISFIGYKTYKQVINVNQAITLACALKKSIYISEEAIVLSTRAYEDAAATFTQITKTEIEKNNHVQDLPYLLNQVPSVIITSDAGTGIGYTGLRIRGSDATRTNVTINGIPLNEAESQGVFWVDLPDLASSVDNIQVQRGVGTSTNGAGAFGASINIETDKQEEKPYTEFNTTFGSYQTEKYNAKIGTGVVNKHWSFNGRVSKISSQGYIENSSSSLRSFFSSGSYINKKDMVKLVVFSGIERTALAWGGVPEDSLKTNRKYNPISHPFTDQTDNYQQDHYQLFYSRQISSSISANIGFHFTRGRGYYEEYKQDQDMSDYKMDTIFIGGDTIHSTNLIRRRWLSTKLYGIVYSLNYDFNDRLRFIIGGAANSYRGEHYGEVVWSQYSSQKNRYDRFYTTYGHKEESNTYIKSTYKISSKLTAFGDIQLRMIDYRISGIGKDKINITQDDQLLFFNPKIGISYQPKASVLWYASYSIANREPNRDDYTAGVAANKKPKPENLKDLEIGYKQKGRNFNFELAYFYMVYKNQLVLTGELNDVGEYLRTNIAESYRTGIELVGNINLTKNLILSLNYSFSQNKIENFTEVIYMYDINYNYLGLKENKYKKTDIAYSPNIISGGELRYNLFKSFTTTLQTKYVGKQFLDNTSNKNRSINAYLISDLLFSYHLTHKNAFDATVFFKVNNLFNELYEANGYTYSEITNAALSTYNYYYPQAERNFLVGLTIKI